MKKIDALKAAYPEHDKVHEVRDKSQAIGEFIEWLESKGYYICEYHQHDSDCYDDDDDLQCGFRVDEMATIRYGINKWLETYFKIDGRKLEEEKRRMLKSLQK